MSNPLIANLKLPGRTFQLPSKGLLYSADMFSEEVKNGEVHIHPLSSITEISLKNPDLLLSGQAVLDVVRECIPAIKRPLELYSRDVDAIMFFLRIATYGDQYSIEVTHDCENAKKHGYVANVESIVNQMKMLDIETVKANHEVLVGGQLVKTRPLLFRDLLGIFEMNIGKKEFSNEDLKNLAAQNLMSMIDSVDGITDREQIREWALLLPSRLVKKITDSAQLLNDWGPEQVVEIKCKDCGETMRVELPVNPINFFTD
jgi:hypothetical protein